MISWFKNWYSRQPGLLDDLHQLSLTFVFLSSFFISCSNTKFLAEDEKLYTRTSFSQQGIGKINDKALKAFNLYSIGNVKTISPFIPLPRTNLTIYNYCKPTGKRGPRSFIYREYGKAPVLLDHVNPDFRSKIMQQRLANMGHFDSEVHLDIKIYSKDDMKARAKYHVLFKPAYTYRNLNFRNNQTIVDSTIAGSMKESLIVPGKDYNHTALRNERIRLSTMLNNQGFFFFNPNHIFFNADTSVGQRQVDMTLMVKDEISEKAYIQYTIRDINVLVQSNNPTPASEINTESIFSNNCFYKSAEDIYKPKRITKVISLEPGKLYTHTQHENTIRYLQGMNAFRSVELSFREVDDSTQQLDAHINLVPLRPVQTGLEFNFSTKSNDFLGPEVIASAGHTNIFKGGEQLVVQVSGGFEWQKRSKREEYELGFNSYEIGTQLKLKFPRFLVPFSIKNQSTKYVPTTTALIGFSTLRRVRYFNMNMSQIGFGYSWRTSPKRQFEIQPVAFNYVRLNQTSEEFDEYLNQYPQVAKSFEEQLIFGSSYSYTYTHNPKSNPLNQFYYNATLDLAGNLINAIYNIANLKDPGSDETGEMFGIPYSQYIKLTNDLRYYLYITEKHQVASRLVAGVGIPFNNSSVLPYIKQYFAGGSQDIRAFYARSIGPGSYSPSDSLSDVGFLDQSGEIKLLGNIEYRFPLTHKTYGAFFLDAGNVWLLNEDETRSGGKFEFNKFLNDMAIGSGLGIRVDLTYVVIRLDFAFPIRKPYMPKNENWIFNNGNFFGDYIFSLAIGYPF
jgi:outer membrane protein assembly factor BamA